MLQGKLSSYYVDLHIHIGRTRTNRPVKITASNQLTLPNIMEESVLRKGMDMLGVIDAQSPEVLDELEESVICGDAHEYKDGGIRYKDKVTILLGAELEVYDEFSQGPIHVLCFLPTIESMRYFSRWCSGKMKNIHLSSQRIYVTGKNLQQVVKKMGGWFIPAHVFTPFKSLYGKGVEVSLQEVFDPSLIDAIELGLSADTTLAGKLIELNPYTFISNSDAHSTSKIAREHQVVQLAKPTFVEMGKALKNENGRRIVKNIGLDPRLGKYHQTVCRVCNTKVDDGYCLHEHREKIVKGVYERIQELSAAQKTLCARIEAEEKRPPYIHHVPLQFIPGVGPKTLQKLLQSHTEMEIVHELELEELVNIVPIKIALLIIKARSGKLLIEEGGGGTYGKIK
ncbi:endonuclease Q family protein [Evansella sp. AB-rgal1]|uniref:endonuclease Q family protein n=1 Tax=Evansella sp. AB-rgal1 TaxID=3242696 RepID=UPI00359ECDB5